MAPEQQRLAFKDLQVTLADEYVHQIKARDSNWPGEKRVTFPAGGTRDEEGKEAFVRLLEEMLQEKKLIKVTSDEVQSVSFVREEQLEEEKTGNEPSLK